VVELGDLGAILAQQREPQPVRWIKPPATSRAGKRGQSGTHRLAVGQPLDQLQWQTAQQRLGL